LPGIETSSSAPSIFGSIKPFDYLTCPLIAGRQQNATLMT